MARTNTQIHEIISNEFNLVKTEGTSREHRIQFAHEIVESVIKERGEKPVPAILHRLATLILQDELRDNRSNKLRNEDYPILSRSQERRRRTGIGCTSLMGEISEKAMQDVGIDRRNYRSRTRTTNRRFRELFKI